jgi:DNA (cytosine-5)-methyltransferase 1
LITVEGFVNELALFAGAGGGILGGKLLGWRTVCAVEWEPYPASVLVARQNDKVLPPFPIWDDVQTFDGKPWRGIVDVISGGFPCQDISSAGKGAGIDGERSGMWREMARIICEVEPRFVFVENSPMLTSRGLGRVLGDLSSMGFDAAWGVLGAANIGANHQRDRIWIVARNVSNSEKLFSNGSNNYTSISLERETESEFGNSYWQKNVSDTNLSQQQRGSVSIGIQQENSFGSDSCWWETEPNVGRVADGVDARVDRLKAIGNGQVPLCAATAWKILSKNVIDARLGRS